MKRVFYTGVLFVLLACSQLWGQTKVTKAFLYCPQRLLPALSEEQRKDLVDLYMHHATTKATITNAFGGQSTLQLLGNTYAKVNLDAYTELQLKVLEADKDDNPTVVAIVYTSLLVPNQSVVRVYNARWEEVSNSAVLQLPETHLFFKPSKTSLQEIKEALTERGVLTYRATFTEEINRLQVRLTCFDDSIAQKRYHQVRAQLLPQGLMLMWDGKTFK